MCSFKSYAKIIFYVRVKVWINFFAAHLVLHGKVIMPSKEYVDGEKHGYFSLCSL
jgi:hypothetical protein